MLALLAAAFAFHASGPTADAQYGIYFDAHRKDLTNPPRHLHHPHVDGVLLRFSWAELEPRRGKFRFDIVEQRIAPWVKARKKVIVGISLTAQREGFTPDWVFARCPAVNFIRTGKNAPVRQIKCWDPAFLPLTEGLITAFGKRYCDDRRIEAVMIGVGHLGFLTAAPNAGGARAFIENGWTPKLWTEYALKLTERYRRAFPDKPLLLRGSPLILRARRPEKVGFPGYKPFFTGVRDDILLRAAKEYDVSIGANGLEADAAKFLETGIPNLLVKLAPGALAGKYRLELSDDWPLWVPPEKRRRRINRGKDNAHFKTCLENAIGGVRGIPPTHISFMKMLADDLNCTDPKNRYYQRDCEAKLRWFKSKLRK